MHDDGSLVFFNVVSLFTSGPAPLALPVAITALSSETKLSKETCLMVDKICRLLNLCLTSTFFFAGWFYNQISGTAIGAAVSVTMTNLTLEAMKC